MEMEMEMDNVCDPARMLLSRFNDSHQAYVKHTHYTFGTIPQITIRERYP